MLMPGRSYNSAEYRYGFNGQEKDDEVYGSGNINTAEFWQYDTRLGRRWNVDPKPVVGLSQYSAFANNPVLYNDIKGDTVGISLFKKDDSFHKQAKDHLKDAGKVDGVFAVYAHGNPQVIVNSNTDEALKSPRDILNELGKSDPKGALLKAIDNKDAITLILYSCNTGTNSYIDKDGGYQLREYDQSVAEKIHEAYPNINVVAPVGYQNYNTGKGPNYVTKYSAAGERTVISPQEAYRTFSSSTKTQEKTSPDSNLWQSAKNIVSKIIDFFISKDSKKE
jgi:hypothetical protein